MTSPQPLLPALTAAELPVPHAFFTRQGGVSEGVYASLNGGVGSRDEPARVAENRRRMRAHLGADVLIVPYQTHSASCLTVDRQWLDAHPSFDDPDQRPRADALATRLPGVALGVTGADCGTILFADRSGAVVGAAHAGWKGALSGILDSTIAAMEALGAARQEIVAVLGPCVAQASYETGAEFRERFVDVARSYDAFFTPSDKAGHFMFDLHGFIGHRLEAAGIAAFVDLGLDTYADEDRFYSYRRMTHRGEGDYGRLVSAILRAS